MIGTSTTRRRRPRTAMTVGARARERGEDAVVPWAVVQQVAVTERKMSRLWIAAAAAE